MLHDLLAEMTRNGLSLHNDIRLDGTIHRYGKNSLHDSKDEWYIGYESDNFIYCTYGSWSSGEKYTFRSGNMTDEEREQFDKEIAEAQKLAYEAILEERNKARATAQEILSKSLVSKNHPYKDKKKIVQDVLLYGENIVVPFQNIRGDIESIQQITPTGEKLFLKGGKVRGNFHVIGDLASAKKIYLCEGFATGDSIRQAVDGCVVVCGSLGNLIPVTSVLKAEKPECKFYLCQDIGETADAKTKEWKDKFQGAVLKPLTTVQGSDFNDVFVNDGLDELKNQLKANPIKTFKFSQTLEIFNQPIEWIVPDQITKNSVTMIHARGGVGKSRVLLELMFALVERDVNLKTGVEYPKENSSIRWLQWNVPGIHKCLYIDTELRGYQIRDRMQDITKIRKSVFDENDFSLLIKQELDEFINFYDLKTRDRIDCLIEEHDVIFIDNLQNALIDTDLNSENKENDPRYWCLFFEWIKKWTKQGKTFILAHHTGKSGSYRGTSRQEGDVDNLIKLSHPQEHKIQIQDECNLAFVYEMEKGRDVKFCDRKPFLARQHESYTDYKGNWMLEDLEKIQANK